MPSTARKHQLQGALIYHIMNRGNRRDDIFHRQKDYNYFIGLLANYSDRFEVLIYHWVIMPNHYHILIEIKESEKLSKMMAGIARSYVYYYQKNYNLGGHIWQGRFKSQPIEKEKYLLSCGRYIERNPIKAKIVKNESPIGSVEFKAKLVYEQGRYIPRREGKAPKAVVLSS